MKRLLTILFCLATLWGARAQASATDIYITPNGATNGVCTTNTHPPSFFNNSGNWGAGATQIGPDTIVHLCGTFSSTVHLNSPMLIPQGSGTLGHPIIVFAEAGTLFTNPAWGLQGGAAIIGHGSSYITFDGNNVGIVEDTQNGGAGYAGHLGSNGFYILGGTGVIVKNWIVRNMCHLAITDTVGCNESSIDDGAIVFNNCQNCSAIHNTISYTNSGITDQGGVNSNNALYTQNTIDHVNWGIAIGVDGASNHSNNAVVSFNHVTDAVNWDGNGGHHNCVFLFTGGTGVVNDTIVNSNLCDGDSGFTSTSWCVFADKNTPSGQVNRGIVINNVCVVTGTHAPSNAFMTGIDNQFIVANNTIYGNGVQTGKGCLNGSLTPDAARYYNNICASTFIGVFLNGGATITDSDYNDFYNITDPRGMLRFEGHANSPYATIPLWTANTGFDSHSITGNPNLSGTYTLLPGSAAICAGRNLTFLGIPALNVDKNGNARPSTGCWDMGAYNSGVAPPPPPVAGPPPALFSAIVDAAMAGLK